MRVTRTLFNKIERFAATGITGLHPVANPRPILLSVYNETLSTLQSMPTSAVYRKATEALTKQRISVVEGTEDVHEIEQKISSGLIEELIHQAQDELSLAKKLSLWKPWEELEDPIPEGQWVQHGRK